MLFYCPFYCLDYADMSATIKLKKFLKNFKKAVDILGIVCYN